MPGKKKRAREIRNTEMINPDGTTSTHRMEYGKVDNKYVVNPTIFPEEDGSWTDLGGQGMKAYNEASKRGETFEFKNEKRASKFAHGSWKKGKDRRESMREYREMKKDMKRQEKSNLSSVYGSTPIKNKSIDKLFKNK